MFGGPQPKKGGGATPLSPKDFVHLTGVSRETMCRLSAYAKILIERQRKQNLVSANSLTDLWGRHFFDSYQLIEHLPSNAKGITDIGSGAGFPGLVLAISTGIPTVLVDSNKRKSEFLGEVIQKTRAPAVVVNLRVEQHAKHLKGNGVDVLTARAIAPLSKLCELAELLSSQTCLFLKGKNWRKELTQANKQWKITFEAIESLTSKESRILRITELERR
tara:strand:- start:678 stop:1334 length:657 start_codon:yes stop_codon:yes gene_type:complete